MIKRKNYEEVINQLKNFPVVALLGPRQVGKTTLALSIVQTQSALYLDLENYQDLMKLDDPIAFLSMHQDKLIILDEIQRKPELFVSLRSLVDKNRQNNRPVGQFLILGSASMDLLKQSSESLAGRICYIEMSPITINEITFEETIQRLWLRGGFPDSLLASTDMASMTWRQMFIKTYLERDIPFFNQKIPTETLRRLWIMIAHHQGSLLNASQFAASLGISSPTVNRYIDLLVDLFLVRRLLPWYINTGKRLVKSPKLYIRDSGLLHALLNLSNLDQLLSYPIVGYSWEGFVIDNIVNQLPIGTEAYFYRTIRGAELDLYLRCVNNQTIAVEIKRSLNQKLSRGFFSACEELQPTYKIMIYDGVEKFPMSNGVIAMSLHHFLNFMQREIISKNE